MISSLSPQIRICIIVASGQDHCKSAEHRLWECDKLSAHILKRPDWEVRFMNEVIPVRYHTEEPLTVHNVNPVFKNQAAQEKKKQEIAQILYTIFSKYD